MPKFHISVDYIVEAETSGDALTQVGIANAIFFEGDEIITHGRPPFQWKSKDPETLERVGDSDFRWQISSKKLNRILGV